MISIEETTWEKLSKPFGELLTARIAIPEITDCIYCALDEDGKRHILIILDESQKVLTDFKSRGISVITRDLTIQQQEKTFVDITCLETSGYPLFNIIGGEIALGLMNRTASTIDIVSYVISKWRRFWGQLPHHILSREEQLGLFAELFFISDWLIPNMGLRAILGWNGPWGSRHDFEWEENSVEVKATTNSRGRIHMINGVDQLVPPLKGNLYLFSIQVRCVPSGNYSLPQIIEAIHDLLLDCDDEYVKFENGLIQTGYSPIHQEEYSEVKYEVVDAALFIVNRNFPRIVADSFSSGIPSGVEQINYEINLNTFENLIIAKLPEELPKL